MAKHTYPVRLRLKVDLPVEAKHGMTKGRVVLARRLHPDLRLCGDPWWYTMGDAGEEVGILFSEAESADIAEQEASA